MEKVEALKTQMQINTGMEAGDTSKAIERLNDLIEANRGLADIYQSAAEHVQNDENKRLLLDAAKEQDTFVHELSNLVTANGGEPASGKDKSTFLKKTWVSLKSAVTDGDGPILTEAAQEAEKMRDAYAEMMSKNLPDDARDLVRRHLSESRLTAEKLLALGAIYDA